MVPTINSFALFQQLPDARLILYPDSGHGAMFQYADAFVGEGLRFLAAPDPHAGCRMIASPEKAMSEAINSDRRRLVTGLILSVAARPVREHWPRGRRVASAVPTSFGALKQVDAGVLERRVRRSRSRRRPRGDPPARMAVRHPQLRGRRAHARRPELPRDRAASPRSRNDALPRCRDAQGRSAGSDRRRRHRPDGRARRATRGACRVRLGRTRGLRGGRVVAGAMRGARLREQLLDPGHRKGRNARASEDRSRPLVPVLLHDRTRAARSAGEPARLRAPHVGAKFADVGVRRRHLLPQRDGLRQPGLRGRRDPFVPPSPRAGRG